MSARRPPVSRRHADERGIAMVLALFMVLVMSALSTSLMFVSQTETWSSANYRLTSQARYGAESGLHQTIHHLLYTYAPPGDLNPGDDLSDYDTAVSPVTLTANDMPVVLSSDPDVESNYPVEAVQEAFDDATTGSLNVTNGTVTYNASARLLSMRQFTDQFSNSPVTLQTWKITANGIGGANNRSVVEVSAIIERQLVPAFKYAAFATAKGCAALSFAGGATTDSYNSSAALVGGVPALVSDGGNVGTNGNLTISGDPTTIHGSLSTPRSGVGECTSNNVTAQTISDQATVDDGLTELSQSVEYPDPEAPNPLPPTTAVNFTQNGGCPAGVTNCVASAGGATITPGGGTVSMGNVALAGNTTLHLGAGTYIVNSLSIIASAQIIIDSGPVIFKIAGQDVAGSVLKIEGDGISNPSFNPQNLQFVYGGTGDVQVAGGTETAALLYAPNATGGFAGGSHFYGAVILKQITSTGGASIHYDQQLQNAAFVPGKYMMSSFTWRSF